MKAALGFKRNECTYLTYGKSAAGPPCPTAAPQDWLIIDIDLKDSFFTTSLSLQEWTCVFLFLSLTLLNWCTYVSALFCQRRWWVVLPPICILLVRLWILLNFKENGWYIAPEKIQARSSCDYLGTLPVGGADRVQYWHWEETYYKH